MNRVSGCRHGDGFRMRRRVGFKVAPPKRCSRQGDDCDDYDHKLLRGSFPAAVTIRTLEDQAKERLLVRAAKRRRSIFTPVWGGMMTSYPVDMAIKKVAITLHRTRSEVIQEALRTHFGEPVYVPSEAERRMLDEALAELERDPDAGRSWPSVREDVWPRE
jgi:predicted transcriptional regulator